MKVATKKYNPGFLSDDELMESFCVRTSEFESIVETLNESNGNSNPHMIVIGPRGMGKTHLLLRVAAEMRRNPGLKELFPVVFAEESYEVGTCGEFWLECLNRLADQAPTDERDNLRLTYQDLRTVRADRILADRCLGALLDFADHHGQRLVLLVENLNMLFADMIDKEAGWRLRKTLQTEPRIILLGSATSRFKEIDQPDHALYDLLRVIPLHPLDTKECSVLWQRISGNSSTPPIRPLEILTGGSPRLIVIIATFGTGQSFRELMDNLLDLVDEHTEYFKSHLDSLPAQERRVYLALARLWKPATTKEIADQARLNTNTCSALLRRLAGRGAVTIDGGTARRRQYYITERLYNIYYLMRRSRGMAPLVEALIQFMASYYSAQELVEFGLRMARDAELADSHSRRILQQAFEDLISLPEMEQQMQHLLELLTHDDVVSQFGSIITSKSAIKFLIMGFEELEEKILKSDRPEDMLDYLDQFVQKSWPKQNPEKAIRAVIALIFKGRLLHENERLEEALAVYEDINTRFGSIHIFHPYVVSVLPFKGFLLSQMERFDEAVETFDKFINRIAPNGHSQLLGQTLVDKGIVLGISGRIEDAIEVFDEVTSQFGPLNSSATAELVAKALVFKGTFLAREGKTLSEDEAAELLQRLTELDELPFNTVGVFIQFSARVGPTQSLELIQASPAEELLLPLVTALQQELGEAPRVSREVDEVAKDIRRKLRKVQSVISVSE